MKEFQSGETCFNCVAASKYCRLSHIVRALDNRLTTVTILGDVAEICPCVKTTTIIPGPNKRLSGRARRRFQMSAVVEESEVRVWFASGTWTAG